MFKQIIIEIDDVIMNVTKKRIMKIIIKTMTKTKKIKIKIELINENAKKSNVKKNDYQFINLHQYTIII